jgi:hypothetical protein
LSVPAIALPCKRLDLADGAITDRKNHPVRACRCRTGRWCTCRGRTRAADALVARTRRTNDRRSWMHRADAQLDRMEAGRRSPARHGYESRKFRKDRHVVFRHRIGALAGGQSGGSRCGICVYRRSQRRGRPFEMQRLAIDGLVGVPQLNCGVRTADEILRRTYGGIGQLAREQTPTTGR